MERDRLRRDPEERPGVLLSDFHDRVWELEEWSNRVNSIPDPEPGVLLPQFQDKLEELNAEQNTEQKVEQNVNGENPSGEASGKK